MADGNGGGTGRRRVVVTGLGAVTPLGNDFETTWANLLAGESGASPITRFDASGEGYATKFACELKDFEPTNWIDRKAARRMDLFSQMIISAARQAEADSGLDIAPEADRIGVSVATAAPTRSGSEATLTPLSRSAMRAADRAICEKRSIRRACFRSIHTVGSKSFSSHAKRTV